MQIGVNHVRWLLPCWKNYHKSNIYKIDTEVERELAGAFGIRSIPSILFCPKDGQPQMAQGALPKETFQQVIDDVLLGVKKES